jgi:2-keto-3-deoxy-6-phosphogluconate aldolase
MTFPSFSAGEILRATDMNAVGMWLVKSQAVGTGVSSVTVTGAFSADYDNYRIVYDGGTSNTNASLQLQLGATTSGYQYAVIYNQYSAPTPLGIGVTAGASFVEAGRAAINGCHLNADLFDPFLTKPTGFRSASMDFLPTSGFIITGGGMLNNTTSYTAFTITPVGGGSTLTGGTIRVYGYKN